MIVYNIRRNVKEFGGLQENFNKQQKLIISLKDINAGLMTDVSSKDEMIKNLKQMVKDKNTEANRLKNEINLQNDLTDKVAKTEVKVTEHLDKKIDELTKDYIHYKELAEYLIFFILGEEKD